MSAKLDEVILGVDNGIYRKLKVKQLPGGRKPSRAFDTFLKIVDNETGEDVKNGVNGFFFCLECKTILERNISNGTSALLTHQAGHERHVKPSSEYLYYLVN